MIPCKPLHPHTGYHLAHTQVSHPLTAAHGVHTPQAATPCCTLTQQHGRHDAPSQLLHHLVECEVACHLHANATRKEKLNCGLAISLVLGPNSHHKGEEELGL